MEVDGMAVRVLIADGSGFTRDVVRRHLEFGGCQVIAEAETAAQAVNLFRTVRPDVVAMDVGLPRAGDLDALSVLRTIRKEAPAVNVIMLSTESASEANRTMFINEGALDCIAEPIDGIGFERMWRRLAEAYPELKNATPAVAGPRALRRS
jgi:chemotaxis response regulator CheB